MPICLLLYPLPGKKKKNFPCYTFPVKSHSKFPCCYFRTAYREFSCIQQPSSHCSTSGSSLILYLELCRSLACEPFCDHFQKCISHAQCESRLWRWTWAESIAVVTHEHVPQVFWNSKAWHVLIQWKKKRWLHIMRLLISISVQSSLMLHYWYNLLCSPHTYLSHII